MSGLVLIIGIISGITLLFLGSIYYGKKHKICEGIKVKEIPKSVEMKDKVTEPINENDQIKKELSDNKE